MSIRRLAALGVLALAVGCAHSTKLTGVGFSAVTLYASRGETGITLANSGAKLCLSAATCVSDSSGTAAFAAPISTTGAVSATKLANFNNGLTIVATSGNDVVIRSGDSGTTGNVYISNQSEHFAQFTNAGMLFAAGAGANVLYGSGSPASVVTAPVGSVYLCTNGGTGTTLYVKESGTGNTGWVAK